MKKGQTTLTARRDAVRRTFSLVKDGTSITKARQIVAKEINVKPNTLWLWQNKLNLKTPNVTRTVKLVRNNGHISNSKDYSFGDMAQDVRGIMRSIVRQDGQYTIKEANVVGKLYGNEISRAKLQLEVHKHNTKISTKTKNNNLLQLT